MILTLIPAAHCASSGGAMYQIRWSRAQLRPVPGDETGMLLGTRLAADPESAKAMGEEESQEGHVIG